ncbi:MULTISPECIES: glycosyltransferase [unclassified Methylophaga]|uniref:glycosyltransferase n=1 Tax=unclassified Methylophaga TaxID=2629249 RepID=UPI000C89BE5F|nr:MULTISPECIES: glycosyltransferase [unclassified Methylophaga]MAK67314.1 colanic acid biosynthesis glycosyltransferase WcaL [Methylophaga sp.]MAY18351.1 colanic acid biosynthesis glycosyltransferase WcaL [Methylophaga sp.]|tara:strand:+ start:66779 stop:68038 length:1260 start_codon:yes stop_codon:yes gene_type:complete
MPDKAESLLRIAYLAPEIPALSATFVYNEILELGKQGAYVKPFSVHRPAHIASEASLSDLKGDVFHLYETPKWQVLFDNVTMIIRHPVGYLKALGRLSGDVIRQGLISRSALGLCYRFFYAATLAKQLKLARIQHLHVHFAHIPTDIAMYAVPMVGIEFSVQAHANDLFERGWLLKQKVERSAFFATISEFNRRFLADLQADTKKIQIVRCGVDQSWQPPIKSLLNNDIFTIGTVGRLVEKKGIDTLISALSGVIRDGRKICLKIAGNGPLETALKQQVTSLELTEESVQFVGALPHDQVAKFISGLDVFVLSCKKDSNGDMDGIPVVLMEAMLCEVPVISTELSGIPELVLNNLSGLTVPPENDMELSKAICQLMDSSDTRLRIISGGKQRVEDEFLLNKNVARLLKLIKSSINIRHS